MEMQLGPLRTLQGAGLGVAIASWFSVRKETAAGRLACRRLAPPLAYPLAIVHRRDR